MDDVHNRPDERGVAIDHVGVTDLRYPIVVLDRLKGKQETIGQISLSVSLPHHFKGTHMSRFIEVLHEHYGELTAHTLPRMLADLQERLHAESARIDIAFPYFLERVAPVTGAKALLDYQCSFVAEARDAEVDFVLTVRVPVTTLCPCSKAISDYGAHNQRGDVRISVRTRAEDGDPQIFWIEEAIAIAEESASAPLYPLLKRPDERYVTMQAFDNPVFVEDVVRNVSVRLRQDERISWFEVEAINHESIHNHNAFARIEWRRATVA